MDTPVLGKLIDGPAFRDAIHVAVYPAVAGERIKPGQHVCIHDGKAYLDGTWDKAVGIADPFLLEPIEEGQMFWLCLLPNSVTSLRHSWRHPAFVPQLPKNES